MLSIDEAIAHAREVADRNKNDAIYHCEKISKSMCKCAEEHEQLAEWLEDYKKLLEFKDIYVKGMETSYAEFRYKQGIADTVDECCKQISERVKYWDDCAKAVEKRSDVYKIFIALAKNFEDLAEQLKEQKNE